MRLLQFSLIAAASLTTVTACDSGSGDALFTDLAPEVAEVCFQPDNEVQVQTTSNGLEFVRTPDTCFDNLDSFDFAPNYAMVDGLRMHYVDEGPSDGEIIMSVDWSADGQRIAAGKADGTVQIWTLPHPSTGSSDRDTDG